MSKASKCKFCKSVRCHYRIVSVDGAYDEVACNRHIRILEDDADRVLGINNGRLRTHITSTGLVNRGE